MDGLAESIVMLIAYPASVALCCVLGFALADAVKRKLGDA
jgi:hypothetical protein